MNYFYHVTNFPSLTKDVSVVSSIKDGALTERYEEFSKSKVFYDPSIKTYLSTLYGQIIHKIRPVTIRPL